MTQCIMGGNMRLFSSIWRLLFCYLFSLYSVTTSTCRLSPVKTDPNLISPGRYEVSTAEAEQAGKDV